MSGAYKERYGIPGPDVENLVRRFYRILMDSEWERADDWIKWCSENGWQKGLRLCKIHKDKPHGPGNSFFKNPDETTKAIREDVRRRKEERKNMKIPLCDGCQKNCSNLSVGCVEYREWFVKNWNQNISIAKHKQEEVEDPKAATVWRYEHPDLVREGIVWSHTENACI